MDKEYLKQLEEVAFKEASESDIKRENANVDGDTIMGLMLQYGSTASKEICKSLVNEKHLKAHERGDIHIHDMDFLSTGSTTCCQIDLQKLFKGGFNTGHGYLREPNDIRSYAALACIAIQANQNEQHGGQSIPAFDYYMAHGVLKTFRKKLRANLITYLDIKFINSHHNKECVENILSKIMINSIELSKEDKDQLKFLIQGELIKCEDYRVSNSDAIKITNEMIEYVLKKSLIETNRETFQAMEALVHNLNTMNSRAGSQVPFSSLNYGTDISPEGRMVIKNLLLTTEEGLGNGETPIFPIQIFKVKEGINYNPDDPNYDLFKLAMRVSAKRLFPNFSFLDAPFNKKHLIDGDIDTEISYMGCRTRTIANRHGKEVVTSRGNISFTSINLVKIGIENGILVREYPDFKGFYEDLDNTIDLIVNQLLDRFNFQGAKKAKNFPFLIGQGVWMDSNKLNSEDSIKDVLKHGSLSIGFIGLAECLTAFIGEHHGESKEAQEIGLEIIAHIRKRLDEASDRHDLNFALIGTPAEGLSGRFVKIDRERFGKIEGVTDREYYTNSFHVPVYFNTTAYEKIEIEAPYHALTNGGHITYVEVDGDVSKNLVAFEQIIKSMKEAGIGYGSINHPIDRDPICGYSGVIKDICPKCGREEGDIPFDRIRRITGYLVGTTNRFNDAKKAEERDRVKHI